MTGVDVEHTKAHEKPCDHCALIWQGWARAVERVQVQVDKALEILDRYNHSDDGELPECAPEDRWRLYRDLLATLNPEALETKP